MGEMSFGIRYYPGAANFWVQFGCFRLRIERNSTGCGGGVEDGRRALVSANRRLAAANKLVVKPRTRADVVVSDFHAEQCLAGKLKEEFHVAKLVIAALTRGIRY